jgi:uncharacterized phage protein gp47/JayE
MADPIVNQIATRTRSEWEAAYLRSYRLRDPDADTRGDTQPRVDAKSLADQLAVLSEYNRQTSRKIPLSELSTEELDQRLSDLGLPPRFPDLGSSGFVLAKTSASGTHIFAGDELTDESGAHRFQCLTTADYGDGDFVPVAAIDTGPGTNIDAGVKLVWSAPRPGCFPTAEIVEQSDGGGLSGGRLAESDDEVRTRISDTLADPAAAGNDAAYRRFALNSRGHGVPVQAAFTYPCILGPGTTAVVFTMKPARAGASRIPNATQIARVRDYVIGQMPGDDGYLDVVLLAQPTDIVLDVKWADGAPGWADAAPWPPRLPTGAGAIVVNAVTDETHFQLETDNGSYTGVASPAIGQSIGFFDPNAAVFRRKKILTVTGTGPWAIVCDTQNAASDTGYKPVAGDRVSPWSDSLDTLVAPVVDHFDTLGPGEQRTTFFDPGVREKRSPASPRSWPSSITNRLAGELLDAATVPSVGDAVVREGLGVTAPVGSPGATAYLLELGDLAAFPLS